MPYDLSGLAPTFTQGATRFQTVDNESKNIPNVSLSIYCTWALWSNEAEVNNGILKHIPTLA